MKKEIIGKDRLCLALDVNNAKRAIELVTQLKDDVGIFKVGSELYTTEGPKIVNEIINLGGKVFLDLKFHDIPNTVAGAARAATRLGVDIFNLHALGGTEMIRAAVDAAQEEAIKCGLIKPIILAITILTSIDDVTLNKELLITKPINYTVCHFAKLAKLAGVDGVVASPNETSIIRNACGNDFYIVTPGVRPKWSAVEDQKRVMTPTESIKNGSDYIVIGRPILTANNPLEATRAIIKEIELA